MPPRRNDANNANNTNLNIQELAAVIAQQMATVLPGLVNQLTQANRVQNNRNGEVANQICTFKHFNSCHPAKFLGSEGATGLLQWFESMESTFLHSDCSENLKVRYATSVFQKRALTWWNTEKRNRGAETAMALTWDEFKRLMTEEFCPRNEMMKLESEFWNLKQDSGENLAYTNRHHELSLLVPHMVTPLSRAIEKYISGLPRQIQDTCYGSKPTTLEDAIRLAATLTDNHVKAESPNGPKFNNLNRKANNFALTTSATPVVPVNQQPSAKQTNNSYVGEHPLCTTCRYHHATNRPCRVCTNCKRYGHLANYCRNRQMVQQGRNALQLNQTPAAPTPALTHGRACYECGDPNHFRNKCPKLVGNDQRGTRAQTLQLNVQDPQVNQDMENDTLLIKD
ncbi:hypothetical protein E3N88_14674 [Mikania micrantha]|uniref:CCHC-type domain-containing protein n=1 Tax=Mikania micrantha TaxID=192012 RepID=A0A5N6P234_9ASTR|nr:hypothetical protein E3N88_14674 [Mikania micrantha]